MYSTLHLHQTDASSVRVNNWMMRNDLGYLSGRLHTLATVRVLLSLATKELFEFYLLKYFEVYCNGISVLYAS